jgi:DUF1365 family protein
MMTSPADRLSVYMANSENVVRVFDAALILNRKNISSWSLAGVLLRFPLMTAKIIFAIHWEALRLWLKRCPVYTHPAKEKGSFAQ